MSQKLIHGSLQVFSRRSLHTIVEIINLLVQITFKVADI